ncbi:DUF6233 domain-containing protein [Streptomyces sp. NBC_01267]|uniref:DUF6233 domain-containing protein n=1 Tax=unclassified Streptomyces TaxID=2593676 RepID=UPI002DDC7EAC|nr:MULTISPECIES: DUF6233 domain-containing protein [unclassified Streptomyces]WSC24993.1 DUF6233 domain-containing protein [Streptomyces sp. NBC_01766]
MSVLDHRRRPRGQMVHVHDCEVAGEAGREIDLDQALTALRGPGGGACQEYDAAAALLPLR